MVCEQAKFAILTMYICRQKKKLRVPLPPAVNVEKLLNTSPSQTPAKKIKVTVKKGGTPIATESRPLSMRERLLQKVQEVETARKRNREVEKTMTSAGRPNFSGMSHEFV
jgi:biopolymer transport protein ExbD